MSICIGCNNPTKQSQPTAGGVKEEVKEIPEWLSHILEYYVMEDRQSECENKLWEGFLTNEMGFEKIKDVHGQFHIIRFPEAKVSKLSTSNPSIKRPTEEDEKSIANMHSFLWPKIEDVAYKMNFPFYPVYEAMMEFAKAYHKFYSIQPDK